MYYLLYGFFFLLSLLPLTILYLISDFFYFIVYYVIGYRKNVVLQNLAVAFPEKTEQARIEIAKKFYRNFTDSFIETIKLLSAGKKWIQKHYSGDHEILFKLHRTGKGARANDAAVVFAHLTKTRRGHYQAHLELAAEDPNSLPEKELTRTYIRYLERVIRESPEMWLWSHRRWKHEWKPEYGEID